VAHGEVIDERQREKVSREQSLRASLAALDGADANPVPTAASSPAAVTTTAAATPVSSYRRALMKKLRHIEELKERAVHAQLNGAQQAKLAKEAEVRASLANLPEEDDTGEGRGATLPKQLGAAMPRVDVAPAMCDSGGRRAIEKKLRQIEELKERVAHGEVIDERQREKVSREQSLRASLAALDGADANLAPTAAAPASSDSTVNGAAQQQKGQPPAPPQSPSPVQLLEVGSKLEVDGRAAKVRTIEEGGEVRVRFEDGTKEKLRWPADSGRVRLVRPPKRQREEEDDSVGAAEERVGGRESLRDEGGGSTGSKAEAASGTGVSVGAREKVVPAVSTALSCSHCGRFGHTPRACSYGLEPSERFLLCDGAGRAIGCFPRLFIVPLRRARPTFDVNALRDGRVDVGVRCVSSALFRSQSLRQNSQVLLCFGGGNDEGSGGGTVGGNGGVGSSSSSRVVQVCGRRVSVRENRSGCAEALR